MIALRGIKMGKITKIGVLFSVKLLGIYGAGIGLIAGIIYSFGAELLLISWLVSSGSPPRRPLG
jgi:hypothetical protein